MNANGLPRRMAKSAGVRIKPNYTSAVGELRVTNRTGGSIIVRKTAKGLAVVNCCLEEQSG